MYSYLPKKKKFSFVRSLAAIAAASACLVLGLALDRIGSTNAFFADNVALEKSSVKSGFWIPVLKLKTDEADGEGGWHKKQLCVKLSATIGKAKKGSDIFYILEKNKNDDELCDKKDKAGNKDRRPDKKLEVEDIIQNGEKYDGGCIEIPDGRWHLLAQAVNEKNSNWRSNIIEQDFAVDSKKPDVKPKVPKDGSDIQGKVRLEFDLADEFLKSTRLVIKHGDQTIFKDNSDQQKCQDDYEHTWDTRESHSGDYDIFFHAFDQAGNETQQHWKVKVKNQDNDREDDQGSADSDKQPPAEDEQSLVVNSDPLGILTEKPQDLPNLFLPPSSKETSSTPEPGQGSTTFAP